MRIDVSRTSVLRTSVLRTSVIKNRCFQEPYTFALLNRRLYNPKIAKGDFTDIKGNLSVVK
jgi:hypothetical protein